MFTKKYIAPFIVLLLPMLIVSALLNFLYSLNSQDYTFNWLVVILVAIVLDTFITWLYTRKEEEKKSE
jgi:pilus assembly protein TadC